ncbi:MAG: pseudouridine synthase [Clostridium sp.]|jgi:pseudouridine synthase/HAD superfamily hydrolase (TIGR01509 family)|nr:pseudouridine synthase [Clostridiaceae bacterium Marseille-Q3526]MBS6375914.1 pseudouridine synthase [Clostridium sp.]
MEVAVMGTMRLDKFLVEMKKGSRSEVKKLIKSGRVTVDGRTVREPEQKFDPERAQISLDGQTVSYASFEYFMLNKPQGVVSATEDRRFQTVVDLIGDARRKDLFPAGRLDIDTEGLLLITNDGQLAHQLLSPKKHVDKVYFARVEGILPSDVKEQFAKGLTLDGEVKTLPAQLELLKEGPVSEVRLTIHEGKFHQVKRMFEAVGCRVIYLKRLSMGSLVLDETLAPGEYRRLTDDELRALKGEEVSSLENSSPLAGKKAFLFDLDGTLVDSMWMWGAIDVEYLGKFGLTCPPDLQKAIEGMSFSETAAYFKKRFALEASLEEIKADWISMSIEKYRSQVPPKPGTEAFLSWAAKQNIKMAVCTSNGREMVDAVLSSLNLARYFDCIITGCEVAAGKPSPDIYLEAARRMKVSPEECAVFEDVPAGILAGKRAGMEVFAVEDEYSLGMEEKKRALSDFYIRDYRELTP